MGRTEGVGETLPFGGAGYPFLALAIDEAVLAPVRSTLTQSGSILALKGLEGFLGLYM